MTTLIQPFPPRATFTNPDGTPTPAAIRWVTYDLLPRIGGGSALSNTELETKIDEAISGVQEEVDALTETVEDLQNYTAPAAGAVERDIDAKLADFFSVKDFGAIGDGSDATAAFQKAARGVPAANNISLVFGTTVPRARQCVILVPAGTYAINAVIDTGGVDVIWQLDAAALVQGTVGYAGLTGRVYRAGLRQSNFHYGTTDYACGESIRANSVAPDSGAQVLGLTDPSQLATYADRDSVGLYVDNTAPAVLVDAVTATYTATTVTLPSAPAASALAKYRAGMVIDTKHVTKWSGFISSWNTDGSVITVVGGWYQYGGGGVASTPTDGTGCYVNPITKVWGQNTNVFLNTAGLATAASGYEMGLLNNKAAPDFTNDLNITVGFDTVSFGTQHGGIGYLARGTLHRAFEARNAVDYSYYIPAGGALLSTTYGFASQQTQGVPFAFMSGTTELWKVKNDGTMSILSGGNEYTQLTAQNWLGRHPNHGVELGSLATTGTPFLDLHSSGNSIDYDVRIRCSAGDATVGNGSLDLFCKSVLLQPPSGGAARIFVGSGSPNGVVTASPPSIYLNSAGGAGTTLYVKESGTATNTGWVGK